MPQYRQKWCLATPVLDVQKVSSGWRAFLRLWFVLAFSYVGLRVLFNLVLLGWIDVRRVFFQELLLLPRGQALIFWWVTRAARRPPAPNSST